MNYSVTFTFDLFTWASYQIRKIAGCVCAGNAGNVFSRHQLQMKLLVSDPDMHHGTCVTHVQWCMSGSLTHGGGENVPGIPGACATHNFTYLARGPCKWRTAHSYLIDCICMKRIGQTGMDPRSGHDQRETDKQTKHTDRRKDRHEQ